MAELGTINKNLVGMGDPNATSVSQPFYEEFQGNLRAEAFKVKLLDGSFGFKVQVKEKNTQGVYTLVEDPTNKQKISLENSVMAYVNQRSEELGISLSKESFNRTLLLEESGV